jgi:DNA sulfur modification protein DndC
MIVQSTSISESISSAEFLENVRAKTNEILKEIKEQYFEDNLPWVIGFSGGKDSTAILQLIFYAISEISELSRKKEIHVLSNDTLVENPNIVKFLNRQLNAIEDEGKKNLYKHNPALFNVTKVTPKLEDTFWLNLIGKGYPSPNKWFRWCTERMKINPTNDYILQTVNKNGKAIIVLGTRKAESVTRAINMKRYELEGIRIRKHSLPNAYVFAPIAELSTKEVWAYLINNENPWKIDNQELLNVYRNASDIMDCPLVIDDTTPSCGNSRFGCWVCTVVEQDKSMQNMISNGDEWMTPLFDLRNWLKEIRNDETKREKQRRTGQDGLGPFTLTTRMEILEKLLLIEKELDMEFISLPELSAIQIQWNFDGNMVYSVADIYQSIKGKKIMVSENGQTKRKQDEYEILEKVCKKHNVNAAHVKELMELEKENLSFLRRGTLYKDMQSKITKFLK